jgi:hypothetical protein
MGGQWLFLEFAKQFSWALHWYACRPDSEEEDPPVQGPLPFEPDDAPWKKSESGIRKLWVLNFRYLPIYFDIDAKNHF